MKFEEKLVMLRKSQGLSQEELADRIGVSRQAVSRWELGSTMPDAPNLVKLADLFEVTTDYLLGQSEEREPGAKSRGVSDEEIKFALFGGDGEITDAMYDEVKQFAAFVKLREAGKKE